MDEYERRKRFRDGRLREEQSHQTRASAEKQVEAALKKLTGNSMFASPSRLFGGSSSRIWVPSEDWVEQGKVPQRPPRPLPPLKSQVEARTGRPRIDDDELVDRALQELVNGVVSHALLVDLAELARTKNPDTRLESHMRRLQKKIRARLAGVGR